MMLSGKEILKEMENGNIKISPFNENQLNPNSYNLRLADELLIYDKPYHCEGIKCNGMVAPGPYTFMEPIDMFDHNPTKIIPIPKEGFTLYPGILYLGRTIEHTETHNFIPCIDGRSSIGRLGINVHATAGFGDVGFCGTFTLEISVIQPVVIYPNVEICQIYYQEVKGDVEEYHGKYQNQLSPVASRMYEEYK